jgi:hypothetical protein
MLNLRLRTKAERRGKPVELHQPYR